METKWRLRSAQLFLTYPQCELRKEVVLDLLRDIIGVDNIEDYLVAEERHKNGDKHIHAYLKLHNTVDVRDSRHFDLITVVGDDLQHYHGNYQGCRGPKNVIKYCSKDDNYIASFDVEARLKATEGKKKILGKQLLDGKALIELTKENPELIFEFDRI